MAKKPKETASDKPEYNRNEHGNIYSNVTLETPKGRIMWLNLKQPNRKSKKYALTMVFPKDSSLDKNTIPKLKAIKQVGLDLLKEAGKKAKGHKFPPILDGDAREDENPNLIGAWYFAISNKDGIELVDIDRDELEPTDFAAGMICKASIQPSFFTGFGAGIAYQGLALMLIKDDGVRFKGAVDGVSAFTEEDEEDEEETDSDDEETDEDKDDSEGDDEDDSDEDESDEDDDDDSDESEDEEDEEDEDDQLKAPVKKKKAKAVVKSKKKSAPVAVVVSKKKKKSSGASLTDVL